MHRARALLKSPYQAASACSPLAPTEPSRYKNEDSGLARACNLEVTLNNGKATGSGGTKPRESRVKDSISANGTSAAVLSVPKIAAQSAHPRLRAASISPDM